MSFGIVEHFEQVIDREVGEGNIADIMQDELDLKQHCSERRFEFMGDDGEKFISGFYFFLGFAATSGFLLVESAVFFGLLLVLFDFGAVFRFADDVISGERQHSKNE